MKTAPASQNSEILVNRLQAEKSHRGPSWLRTQETSTSGILGCYGINYAVEPGIISRTNRKNPLPPIGRGGFRAPSLQESGMPSG